ncbi:MAG: RNA polymerase sigma factor [Chloroflexota bacterium]
MPEKESAKKKNMEYSTTEEMLIDHLKHGRGEGFELLYATYAHKVYNLAYRITGDRGDAEDITQETFIQACHHIDQFRGDSQFYTWIYTIAKNLCYQLLKQRKKKSFAAMEVLLYSTQGDGITDVFSGREKQILLAQIKDGCFTGLLRCLSFYQRMAFVLHVLLTLPMKDVAGILGKSEGATKVLVHRARQNLKDFLCQNCSLYAADNACRCENLMSFSLAKGWIQKPAGDPFAPPDGITPEAIQTEVEGVRKVVELYKTLSAQTPSEDFVQRIRDILQQGDGAIFSRQKV